jgi:hypothetical protein
MTTRRSSSRAGSAQTGEPAPLYRNADDVAGAALAFHRHLVMEALPGINPMVEPYGLVAARSATLAAVGTFDFPWLIFGSVGWVFSKQLDDVFGDITDAPLKAVTQAVTGVISDLGNLIWSGFALMGGWITAGITGGANLLGGLIGGALTLGLGLLRGAFNSGVGILSMIVGAISTAGLSALGTLGNVVAGALGAVGHVWATALGAVGGALANGLQSLGGMFLTGIGTLGDLAFNAFAAWTSFLWSAAVGLVSLALPVAMAIGAFLKQYILDPLVAVGQAGVQWVTDQLSGIASGDPEGAIGLAGALMLAAIPLGIGAHALAVAAEHSHPLKQVGYGLIARELVELTNLKRISDATIGAGYTVALGRPMEYWLNRRIRWQIPAPRDLLFSYTKRDIGDAELALSMAYHGFNDDRIAAMTASAWREPRPFELRRLMDSGVVAETWLRAKLRRNQLNDDDVDAVASAMMHTQFATQRSALYSAAWRLLKDGASTPARFAADVAELGLPPSQIALGVKAALLDHAADMVNFQTATLLAQAKNGQISVDEFGLALTTIGVTRDRVELEKARARATITGKVALKATAAAEAEYRRIQAEQTTLWVQQFRRGIIDDATLLANLTALGIDPDLATITVQVELARRTPLVPFKADNSVADNLAATVKTLQKAYVDEFRVGLIGAPALTADLLALGLDPDLVDAIVADEQVKAYTPPPATPSPQEEAAARALLNAQAAYLRVEFRAGYITADDYLAGLLDAGMEPGLADVTVDREALQLAVKNAKPVAGVTA